MIAGAALIRAWRGHMQCQIYKDRIGDPPIEAKDLMRGRLRARPMHREWMDHVKQQCDQAGTAFFFKQWGTWSADGEKRSKKINGRRYRGRVWDAMPQGVAGSLI